MHYDSRVGQITAPILGRSYNDAAAWWAETELGLSSYYKYCLAFVYVAVNDDLTTISKLDKKIRPHLDWHC